MNLHSSNKHSQSLTEQEWNEWKRLEVTERLFNYISKYAIEYQRQWASGCFRNDPRAEAEAAGAVFILQQLSTLEYDDLVHGV